MHRRIGVGEDPCPSFAHFSPCEYFELECAATATSLSPTLILINTQIIPQQITRTSCSHKRDSGENSIRNETDILRIRGTLSNHCK